MGDRDSQKRSGIASDVVTCTYEGLPCDCCAQARGTCLSWGRALELQRAASVAGGDVCVVCVVCVVKMKV